MHVFFSDPKILSILNRLRLARFSSVTTGAPPSGKNSLLPLGGATVAYASALKLMTD